jgi:hypothetical protein
MSLCSVLFFFLERKGGWGGEVMVSEFLRCTDLQFHVVGHHLYLDFFLLPLMKVMVCHFVSDSHEVMTARIVMLPLIVVVEISLQLHRSFF